MKQLPRQQRLILEKLLELETASLTTLVNTVYADGGARPKKPEAVVKTSLTKLREQGVIIRMCQRRSTYHGVDTMYEIPPHGLSKAQGVYDGQWAAGKSGRDREVPRVPVRPTIGAVPG